MTTLEGFWYAAARLAGRVDLSGLLAAGVPPTRWPELPPARLAGHGVALDHAAALSRGGRLDHPHRQLTLADPGYPEALRALPFAPPVLFLQGAIDLLERPAVALVGTRRCSDSGRSMARRLARAVVEAGGVVVSGMAWGIDEAAHRAADGRTIAVLGHGLSARTTAAQRELARTILAAGGLLVSEFLPDHPPRRWTFPQRNRIIAGLARATVVVEAGLRSGALITARHAVAFGREVLAVPGHPTAPSYRGCLRLLADGAGLLAEERDLLDATGLTAPRASPRPRDALLGALASPLTLDELVARTGADPTTLVRRLAVLELAGLVRQLPGDRWERHPPGRAGPSPPD